MDPINPDTTMDAVTLRVGDLEGMSSYYAQALALTPLEERVRGREVHRVLGRGATPMVRLIHTPDLPGVDPRQAGLYHTASCSTIRPASRRPSIGPGRTRAAGSSARAITW